MIPSPAASKGYVMKFDEKLRAWSITDPSRAFDDVFSFFSDPRTLRAACCQVAKAEGADTPGIDGVTAGTIEQSIGSDMLAKKLSDDLKSTRYQPKATREAVINIDGKPRTINVLAFCDRVVQRAAYSVLSPIIEPRLHPGCSAYVKGLGQQYAVEMLKATLNDPRSESVISTDFHAFFDTVHIGKLLRLLRKHISDRKMLALLETILTSGTKGEKGSASVGLLQGAPLSPLLSNVYSQPVLEFMTSDPRVVDIIQYGDDCRIGIVGGKDIAKEVLRNFITFADTQLGLQLAHSKTAITQMGGQVDFLGTTTTWKPDGLETRPSSKSIERLKNKLMAAIADEENNVKEATQKETDTDPPPRDTALANIVAGFTNYFGRFGRRSEIEQIGKEVVDSIVGRS